MFQSFYELARTVATLSKDVRQGRAELKEIRQELHDLTVIIHRLAQDLKNFEEQEEERRRDILLEVEDRIMRAGSGQGDEGEN